MRLLAFALLTAASAAPTHAQIDPNPPSRAQTIIDGARRDLTARMEQGDCAQSTAPDEIIVCGRGEADDGSAVYRGLPSEDTSRRARAGGEQLFALDIHDIRCTPVGFNQRCNGGWPILQMLFRAIETIKYQTSHD